MEIKSKQLNYEWKGHENQRLNEEMFWKYKRRHNIYYYYYLVNNIVWNE